MSRFPRSVLFVCTGNIFRSMSAEWALRKYLTEQDGETDALDVSSAGIIAAPQEMLGCVHDRLEFHGINPSAHRQRRVTEEILNKSEIVVAMGLDHREVITTQFGVKTYLFNEIANGREEGILDVHEKLPNWSSDLLQAQAYAIEVVDYIVQTMPAFRLGLKKYKTI